MSSRRKFIQDTALISTAICTTALGSGCSLFDVPEMRVCSLTELKSEPYLISRFNRKKILLTYLEEELIIFSLICSHKRCTVAYEASDEQFVCPCHDGIYDKYGEVIDGPPPEALRRFAYEIRGEDIWVLNKAI